MTFSFTGQVSNRRGDMWVLTANYDGNSLDVSCGEFRFNSQVLLSRVGSAIDGWITQPVSVKVFSWQHGNLWVNLNGIAKALDALLPHHLTVRG